MDLYSYSDNSDVNLSACDAFSDCPIPGFIEESSSSLCTCKYYCQNGGTICLGKAAGVPLYCVLPKVIKLRKPLAA